MLTLPSFEAKITEADGRKWIFDSIRRKYVALTPEEWVRQHFVNYLVTVKGFPKELIANEVAIRLPQLFKRCDTVVYGKDLKPLAIVEYKASTVEITQAVWDQVLRYDMALHADYLIVSNGIRHICCQMDYVRQQCRFLPEIPCYEEILRSKRR